MLQRATLLKLQSHNKGCRTLADFFSLNCRFFVRTSACRTLDDFLSRLTAFRLGALSLRNVGKDACSRDSLENSSLVEVRARLDYQPLFGKRARARPDKRERRKSSLGTREPRQIVSIHRTLADKAQQDVLRSSTVRYRPTSPDLVAELSEFAAH